jgi:hypothetical protein
MAVPNDCSTGRIYGNGPALECQASKLCWREYVCTNKMHGGISSNLIPVSKLWWWSPSPTIGEVHGVRWSHSWHNYFADDMIQLLAYPIRKYILQWYSVLRWMIVRTLDLFPFSLLRLNYSSGHAYSLSPCINLTTVVWNQVGFKNCDAEGVPEFKRLKTPWFTA